MQFAPSGHQNGKQNVHDKRAWYEGKLVLSHRLELKEIQRAARQHRSTIEDTECEVEDHEEVPEQA